MSDVALVCLPGAMVLDRGWKLKGMPLYSWAWYLIIGLEAEVASTAIRSVCPMQIFTGEKQVLKSEEAVAFAGVIHVDEDGKPTKWERATEGRTIESYMPDQVKRDVEAPLYGIMPRGSLLAETELFGTDEYGSFGIHPEVGEVLYGKNSLVCLSVGYFFKSPADGNMVGPVVFSGKKDQGKMEAYFQHPPESDYARVHWEPVPHPPPSSPSPPLLPPSPPPLLMRRWHSGRALLACHTPLLPLPPPSHPYPIPVHPHHHHAHTAFVYV